MTCKNCNCNECQESRIPPITEAQRLAWTKTAEEVIDFYAEEYPDLPPAVNEQVMLNMMCIKLHITPEDYHITHLQMVRFFRSGPDFKLVKGRYGGLMRKDGTPVRTTNIVAATVSVTPVVSGPVISGADNYTCKGSACGNTKLNDQTDTSCWKCGRPVGT